MRDKLKDMQLNYGFAEGSHFPIKEEDYNYLFRMARIVDEVIEENEILYKRLEIEKKKFADVQTQAIQMAVKVNELESGKKHTIDAAEKLMNQCATCDGTGYDYHNGHYDRDVPCFDCHGSGRVDE